MRPRGVAGADGALYTTASGASARAPARAPPAHTHPHMHARTAPGEVGIDGHPDDRARPRGR